MDNDRNKELENNQWAELLKSLPDFPDDDPDDDPDDLFTTPSPPEKHPPVSAPRGDTGDEKAAIPDASRLAKTSPGKDSQPDGDDDVKIAPPKTAPLGSGRGGNPPAPKRDADRSATRQVPAISGRAAEAGTPNGAEDPFATRQGRPVIPSPEPAAMTPPRRGGAISPDSPPPKPEKKRKKRRRHPILRSIFTMAVIIGVSVWLAIFGLETINDYLALDKPDNELYIEIPSGASTVQIAELLEENGLIANALVFRLYSRLTKNDSTYHEGMHYFNTNYSYTQIISELQKAAKREDVVTVTIPEGKTAREIAEILESKGVCDADAFLQALHTVGYDFPYKDQALGGTLRYYPYEGYLFPNTYEFYLDEEPGLVIKKLLQTFESSISESMLARMEELGLTLDETIVLAAMVQAESSGEDLEIMKMVSSVFHNRLEDYSTFPQLQSDPTNFYVRDMIEPYFRSDNQDDIDDYYDAFDTYICIGLPEGAICSPGLDAIEATLYPAETDYFYFVTDLSLRFYWGRTLAEHDQNVATVREINAELRANS